MKYLTYLYLAAFPTICFCQNVEFDKVPVDSVSIREFKVTSSALTEVLDSVFQNNLLGQLAPDEMYLLSLSKDLTLIGQSITDPNVGLFLDITRSKKLSTFFLINGMIGFIKHEGNIIFINVQAHPQECFKPTFNFEMYTFIDALSIGALVKENKMDRDYLDNIVRIDFVLDKGKFIWLSTLRRN